MWYMACITAWAYGTSKALIADLVPEGLRATAFGTHWAPFAFGATIALAAALWLALWKPAAVTTTR